MIRVSVEVHEGAAPFRVAVQAESIGRAVDIIEGRHPGRDVRVVFPIDPDEFFLASAKKTDGNWAKADSYGLFGLPQQRVR